MLNWKFGVREAQLFFSAQRIPTRAKHYHNTFASNSSGSSGVFKLNHKQIRAALCMELSIWHLMEPKYARKKGLHRKNVTCLRNENGEVLLKSISFKWLLRNPSTSLSKLALKTATVTSTPHGDTVFFQLADRDFPKSVLIRSIALFFNPFSTWSLKKKKTNKKC